MSEPTVKYRSPQSNALWGGVLPVCIHHCQGCGVPIRHWIAGGWRCRPDCAVCCAERFAGTSGVGGSGVKYGRIGARDRNEKSIIDVLRGIGAHVWQLHEPADLLVAYRGRWCVLEVKPRLGPRGGDPRPATREQRDAQAAIPAPVPVVRTESEALQVVVARSGTAGLGEAGAAREKVNEKTQKQEQK